MDAGRLWFIIFFALCRQILRRSCFVIDARFRSEFCIQSCDWEGDDECATFKLESFCCCSRYRWKICFFSFSMISRVSFDRLIAFESFDCLKRRVDIRAWKARGDGDELRGRRIPFILLDDCSLVSASHDPLVLLPLLVHAEVSCRWPFTSLPSGVKEATGLISDSPLQCSPLS